MDLDRLERLLQLVQTGLPMRLCTVPHLDLRFKWTFFINGFCLFYTVCNLIITKHGTSIYSQELLFFCFFRIIFLKNDAKVSSQGGDKRIWLILKKQQQLARAISKHVLISLDFKFLGQEGTLKETRKIKLSKILPFINLHIFWNDFSSKLV